MSKVDIISGFLGAGKTTLIKKLIKESLGQEQVVLIENEFGEIGIDGAFLQDAGIEITEMNSGCICCSLVGDFAEALKKVVSEYHPDRIMIEPSGVGKLSDVIKAVEDVNDDELVLNSFVTIIDAKKCRVYHKNFGEFFNNQIAYASSVILSRTQDVDSEKLQDAINIVKELNTTANIITTPWDELAGDTILEAIENKDSLKEILLKEQAESEHEHHHHDHEHEHHHDHDKHDHHHDHEHHHHEHDHECGCGHHHHHHHDADEIFTSLGIETINTYTREKLEEILNTLANSNEYGEILRSKGILPTPDKKWLHFDLVPGEYEVREGPADYTGRLCVIGKDLLEDKVKELFGVQ
ncbi:MAG: GTP-binding protein [Erysipelotrichaceae bacterium]|nr:GTP-binding protein [Erysipelotrichaceae bacterium]